LLKISIPLFFLMLSGMICFGAVSSIQMPALFSDGMIIQREIRAPVWGWSKPMEKISVSASWGASLETVADINGRWQVKLQTPKAGGPFSLTIKNATDSLTIQKVFSGDVWICSGQSNMAMPLKQVDNAKSEIAAANYPGIRLFKTKRNASLQPRSNCIGRWRDCTPESAANFSAIAYFFGRDLYRDIKVPVGLIQSAWGGTGIEAWTPLDAQRQDPEVMKYKANLDLKATSYNAVLTQQKYDSAMKKWRVRRKQWEDNGRRGRAPGHPVKKKHPHEYQNYPGNLYNGMIYPLILYAIKGAIWYQGERNSKQVGKALSYRVQLSRMITAWRNEWQQGKFPFYFVQLPNYRKPWIKSVMGKDIWPYTRESMMVVAKKEPNCGMAIIIDIGDEKNIHPKNKQGAGHRLALIALHDTYGKKDRAWSGPIFNKSTFKGKKAIITFDTGGAPLTTRDGAELFGFALAGKEGKIYKAEANIIAPDILEVSSEKVSEPIMVWYAWADNPAGANLCNKGNLPASPFRTGKIRK
jgi:sialate O-acetylesterase